MYYRILGTKETINSIIIDHEIPHLAISTYNNRSFIARNLFITEDNAPFAILCGLEMIPIKWKMKIQYIRHNPLFETI